MATTVESQQLNTLVRRCGGSEEGAKWLKLAVDPFHDVDLELVGFPDQTPGRSVIYNVTKNITITRPSAVTTGKFDAHVSFTPVVHKSGWVARDTIVSADGHTNAVKTPALNSKTMQPGIIQICTVPAGDATFRAGANEDYASLDYSSLLDVDGSSISRLIGCAFEVHNTTEELHKSGAVTVYRYDNNRDAEAMRLTDGTADSDTYTSNGIHGPPTVEANAKLLNGITWEAADGCLVPCVMDTINEPQKLLPRRNHMITNGGSRNIYWGQEDIEDTVVMFSGSSSFTRVARNADPSMILPFMGSGAYFTGLSAETSLTVTMRAFVEVFPSPGNALVPLADRDWETR